MYLPVSAMPLNNSVSMKLERKSFREKDEGREIVSVLMTYFQMLRGVCIQMATTTNQTSVTGMKIFQPRRMIWS